MNNILVAFEMFHYIKISSSELGSLALKSGMDKAYDRVEWSFMGVVMSKMGFS